MERDDRPQSRDTDTSRVHRRALEEKDRIIAELQDRAKILQLEFVNEKRRIDEKVNRLASEMESVGKSRSRRDLVGGNDIKAMQLRIDELQNKLHGYERKSGGKETSLGVVRALDAINSKLDTLSRAEHRGTGYNSERQLEAN